MTFKSNQPRLLIAALGLGAMAARWGIYQFAVDGKGLIVPFHPLAILLTVLTAAAMVVTALAVRKCGICKEYSANFPACWGAAAGSLIFAAGIALTVALNQNITTTVQLLGNLLGVLSVPALIVAAIFRSKGRKTPFFCHLAPCMFLGVYAVSCYPLWSSDPQLQDAFFPMAGLLLLLLFSYQRSAFDVDLGSRRVMLGAGLMAGFACLAAAPHCPDPLLYLTGTIWVLSNLCSLAVPEAAE